MSFLFNFNIFYFSSRTPIFLHIFLWPEFQCSCWQWGLQYSVLQRAHAFVATALPHTAQVERIPIEASPSARGGLHACGAPRIGKGQPLRRSPGPRANWPGTRTGQGPGPRAPRGRPSLLGRGCPPSRAVRRVARPRRVERAPGASTARSSARYLRSKNDQNHQIIVAGTAVTGHDRSWRV